LNILYDLRDLFYHMDEITQFYVKYFYHFTFLNVDISSECDQSYLTNDEDDTVSVYIRNKSFSLSFLKN
jgi:hypothetical protein